MNVHNYLILYFLYILIELDTNLHMIFIKNIHSIVKCYQI
jgi:hypothetical protein